MEWHKLCGHFSTGRLLPTIISRFYWKNLTQHAKNVSKTCEVCQTSKINPKQQRSPLYPLPVPMFPFQVISFDHKTLSRKTAQGNTHVLAIICHFSNLQPLSEIRPEVSLVDTTLIWPSWNFTPTLIALTFLTFFPYNCFIYSLHIINMLQLT